MHHPTPADFDVVPEYVILYRRWLEVQLAIAYCNDDASPLYEQEVELVDRLQNIISFEPHYQLVMQHVLGMNNMIEATADDVRSMGEILQVVERKNVWEGIRRHQIRCQNFVLHG